MHIDVVIPCFNAAPYIRETIESVLAQTHPPGHVIVVDDGSTDGSAEIAADFTGRVRLVKQTNAGVCVARNHGIAVSDADWVAFVDADDFWEPTKLERQVELAQRAPKAKCIHTGFYLFGAETPRTVGTTVVPEDGPYTLEDLLLYPLVNTSAALVRRDLSVRFPVNTGQGGDMIYFSKLALENVHFAFVPEPLVGYRMHPRQMTREGGSWVRHFINRFRFVEDLQAEVGAARAERLRRLLRGQVVDWLNLARWNRQWERYETLKSYAAQLDWPEGRPAVLSERLLPKVAYSVKDWFDSIGSRNGLPGQHQASQ